MSRSKHSLSNYQLTTCEMGQVIPIGMVPVLPGDVIGHSANALIRVSPMAAPIMHQVDVRIHHFNVAYRTIWEQDVQKPDGQASGWEDFITGGEDGMNSDTVPKMLSTGVEGDLLDHLGIPAVAGLSISELPVRAANFVWNEFYRDQDLQVRRDPLDTTIPNCAWGKDYLTTARPWSQKGPAVSIPVGDQAPVHTTTAQAGLLSLYADGEGQQRNINTSGAEASVAATLGTGGDMYANLSEATGADPLDIRRAWGIQRFMENAARYGSRYPEKMRSLGSNYRGLMDRPEYLGGGSQSINVSEVLQSTPDFVADPGHDFGVGDLYGHGVAAMRSNKYARRIDEHGVILSFMSVRPRSIYQNGIHREWLRTDREDFHDPYLELIGQQEVWNAEVFAEPGAERTVFGYSDKYQEYRGSPSQVTGQFRSDHSIPLDFWHLARQFGTAPSLNEDFIKCVPTKRIHNEQSQPALWCMIHHRIAAHRNMVKNATPRLV